MEKKDIQHLATLARIQLSESEVETLTADIGSILDYVSEINSITADVENEKKVGTLYNVMREDTGAHEAGKYTEDILNAAPERDGAYIKVKKILGDN